MKPLSISVFCPITKKNTVVYCYVAPNGIIIPNGCDNQNSSGACTRCAEKSVVLARDLLANAIPGDFSLDQT